MGVLDSRAQDAERNLYDSIENLLMRFRDESQISYTNLTFESGKTYALLGASGCGKSTLLNLIAGVLTPREGSVFIDGWDICAAS